MADLPTVIIDKASNGSLYGALSTSPTVPIPGSFGTSITDVQSKVSASFTGNGFAPPNTWSVTEAASSVSSIVPKVVPNLAFATTQPSDIISSVRNQSTAPTLLNSATTNDIAGSERLGAAAKVYAYPENRQNTHFITFNINLTEESQLIKKNLVATNGYVDNTGQNRANTNNISGDAIQTGATIAGAAGGGVLGAAFGGKLGAAALKKLFRSKSPIIDAIAGTTALAGGVVGGAIAGNLSADVLAEYIGITNRLKRLASSITLYTPPNVRANYTLDYDMPFDLLVTLSQADQYDELSSGVQAMTRGDMKGLGKFGQILASTNSSVSMLSKRAVNKKADVMFKSVGNRQFVFEYTFAPQSQSEAKTVADIIFMFKYFAHPEMLPGYGNFLYLYPAEFDISYGMVTNQSTSPTQLDNPHLNKISSCVLQNIDVEYAPNGSFQSLEQGEPVNTRLVLVFREIETLHRERIGKGY